MNAALLALVDEKRRRYPDPALVSDERVLGVLISQHLEWDGLAIMRVASAALTDANFHSEAAELAGMAERWSSAASARLLGDAGPLDQERGKHELEAEAEDAAQS